MLDPLFITFALIVVGIGAGIAGYQLGRDDGYACGRIDVVDELFGGQTREADGADGVEYVRVLADEQVVTVDREVAEWMGMPYDWSVDG